MFCENCGHQISDTAKFCSACGHPVGTAPSPGAVAPPAVPAKRESPRLKASSGNGSITKMSGTRRKPWLLRMPIPDPHTGITVMKTVGTYVTREEAEAVRAEMMKRPATPYQDSTLQDCFRMFKSPVNIRAGPIRLASSMTLRGNIFVHCGTSKLPPSMRKTSKTSLIRWPITACLKVCWKKSVLLSVSCIAQPLAGVSWMPTLHLS